METNKHSVGDVAGDGRSIQHRTLGQGTSVQPPAIAPVASATVAKGKVKRLEEYLEASQAVLEAAEQEVKSVCGQ
jgi:hypothetical protein